MGIISSERLAQVAQELYTKKYELTGVQIIRFLLLESLSPAESKAFAFIAALSPGDTITSNDIAEQFGVRLNRAGNILSRLRKLGLIKGDVKQGKHGLFYEWSAVENETQDS